MGNHPYSNKDNHYDSKFLLINNPYAACNNKDSINKIQVENLKHIETNVKQTKFKIFSLLYTLYSKYPAHLLC